MLRRTSDRIEKVNLFAWETTVCNSKDYEHKIQHREDANQCKRTYKDTFLRRYYFLLPYLLTACLLTLRTDTHTFMYKLVSRHTCARTMSMCADVHAGIRLQNVKLQIHKKPASHVMSISDLN